MRLLLITLFVLVLCINTILAGSAGNVNTCRAPNQCHHGGGVTTLSAEDEEFFLQNAALEEEVVSVLRRRVRFPRARPAARPSSPAAVRAVQRHFFAGARIPAGPARQVGGGRRKARRSFGSVASRAANIARSGGRRGRKASRAFGSVASRAANVARSGSRRGRKAARAFGSVASRGGRRGGFISNLIRKRPISRAIGRIGRVVGKRWQRRIADFRHGFEKAITRGAPRSSKYSALEQKEQDWWWSQLENGNIVLPDGKCATSCDWFLLTGAQVIAQLNINVTKSDYDPDNICVECDRRWLVYKGPCRKFPDALRDGSIPADVADDIRKKCRAQMQGGCVCDKQQITPQNVGHIRLRVRKSAMKSIGKFFKNFGKMIGKAFKAVGKVVKRIGRAVGRVFRGIGKGLRRLFRR